MADKSITSEESVMIDKEEMEKLVEKAKESGTLSFTEINNAISGSLTSPEQIEDIVEQFQELGITLVNLQTPDKKTGGKPKSSRSPFFPVNSQDDAYNYKNLS